MSQALISLLNKVIGNQGKKLTKEDEYVWYCPKCNHYKRKLQINIKSGYFHCWVCEFKGRTLFQMFKKLGASQEQYTELSGYVQHTPQKIESKTQSSTDTPVNLPSEYKPLWEKSNNLVYKHAINYLKKRGIGLGDIIKYSMGYCETGLYKDRIIIPSYDENGRLNFFVGRHIFEGGMKYRNSPTPKDIVGFDLYINWDEPITLCEGPFDAISIKRNAIPLFGTVILEKLEKKIIEKKVKTIYLSLDRDAFSKSITIIENLMNHGVEVKFIDFPDDKDAGDLGFEKMVDLINGTESVKFSDLIRFKMNNGKTKRHLEIF